VDLYGPKEDIETFSLLFCGYWRNEGMGVSSQGGTKKNQFDYQI